MYDFEVQKKAIAWCNDCGIANGTFDGVHIVSKSDLDVHTDKADDPAVESEYITLCEAIPLIAEHIGWYQLSANLTDTIGRELKFKQTDNTNISVLSAGQIVGSIYKSRSPNDGSEIWKVGTGRLMYKYNPIASMFIKSEDAIRWVRRNADYVHHKGAK